MIAKQDAKNHTRLNQQLRPLTQIGDPTVKSRYGGASSHFVQGRL